MPGLDSQLRALLPGWLAQQRWYTGKGREPRLRRIGGLRLAAPTGPGERSGVDVETHLVLDEAPTVPVLYQVPLTYRDAPLQGAAPQALVGTADSGGARRWVYDACHDPVGATALLRCVTEELEVAGDGAGTGDGPDSGTWAEGHHTGLLPPLEVRGSRVLAGEQSNTSVVLHAADVSGSAGEPVDRPLILKVFRVLHAGRNPDVELQQALALAGSPHVPAPVGDLLGRWPGPDGAPVTGHLAVVQEFLPGAPDAWRVTLAALQRAEDPTARARALGEATAEVHATLAATLPTTPPDEDARAAVLASWRARHAAAAALVPALDARHDAVEAVFAAGAAAPWPALQRIHGDYHLGQVLDVPGRGWVLLDFEGEPLRPLAERTAPDLPERDVAGMLRSYDYAAASVEIAGHVDGDAARAWAERAREAFLDGYAHLTRSDPRDNPALLRALELDKALYEVAYEAGNRPSWLPVPLAGVERILGPGPDAPAGPGATPPRAARLPTDGHDGRVSSMSEPVPVDPDLLREVAHGRHHDPHAVLGAHPGEDGVTIRTVRHLADAVAIVTADGTYDATHEQDGVWVAVVPGSEVPDYRVRVAYGERTQVTDDPYRFLPTVGEMDQYLIGEGRHEQLWQVLGAHVRRYPSSLSDDHGADGVEGVGFAVWAPNATAVRVVGDFNAWDGRGTSMRALGSTGVWELFVPGIGPGERYKFELGHRDGTWQHKADPLARRTEVPPATASVVEESDYVWGDEEWLARRAASDPHGGPMSVYEVHLGSWRPGLSYLELAEQLVEHVQAHGFTHVELMPVAEHPFGGSWGYQVTSYYAPSSRFGSPDELRHLIDRLHRAGVGVIVDWVPAHFPKDAWALARFDGTALYEDPDPLRGEHQDWGTYVFNFGRREVRNFLVANALYWLEEFHVDGLRVDAVASMLYLDYSRKPGQWRPNVRGGRENLEAISFLQETNATAYRKTPGIVMVAEESTAFPGVTAPTSAGGLGFGLKWNMGWMNDTLRYLAEEPINRRYHHGELTFSLVYAFSEQFVLPLSHDEVVHGKGSLLRKMPGDRWQQLAGVRALLAYQWSHPGKQLLFMGQEFAQEAEWSESRGLDWWHLDDPGHAGVARLVARLNEIYRQRPALWSDDFSHGGFAWIEAGDGDHNVLAYLRRERADGEDDAGAGVVACVVNFAGTPHEGYRIGLPHAGGWLEVLNTDAEEYGGSGVGNLGRVVAEEQPWHGYPASATLRVPPLGAVWLVPDDG
ncbi:1,4-alpha-glucan branching protein GlgB [Georgenia alba]|uniref:1,4-alpha-glucan branching enzyme GlgB n=1 Tax=Georgenia alba TaxID=2233858 RepID=A0ABW2QA13_9MICO